MSGILALFNRNAQPVDRHLVETMLSTCQEHAADGQNLWFNGSIVLAHQHFWITPEEKGELQPLVDIKSGCAITCDARLDNRQEIIHFLHLNKPESHPLSDTQLILQAYLHWGANCVDHLLGDFAFAVWDAQQQHLFLARDALGVRGICYYLDHERCIAASEISQLLAHPAVVAKINEGRVAEFLANNWENQEETFFETIFYLPPAFCLIVTADSQIRRRYWDIDPRNRIRYRGDEEYAEHYLGLLSEAVRCRLRSTGPVGISLSGGLDSTSLAALIADNLAHNNLGQARLKSFSYAFNHLESCDERRYIQPIVERFQLEAAYLPCDELWTLRDIHNWPVERDFVLSDPYAWLPETVMKTAQESGIRLLLAGYFGDVLFTGGHFWVADLISQWKLKQLVNILVEKRSQIIWRKDLFEFGLRSLLPARIKRAYRNIRPRPIELSHPGLHPSFVKRTHLRERIAEQSRLNRYPAPGQASRHTSLTNSAFSQGAMATRKFYNRHGLEIETPYWDRRLVEFVMALPAYQLGRPGRNRWVHRNAMQGWLPEMVRERTDKTTFEPLFKLGVLKKERATVRQLLEQPEIVRREMVSSAWLKEKVDDSSLDFPDLSYLWFCISLELWLRQYW